MTCPTGGAAPCVILQRSLKPTREDCERTRETPHPSLRQRCSDRVVGQFGLTVVDESGGFVTATGHAQWVVQPSDDLEKRGQIFGVGDDAGTRRRCDGSAQARRITDLPKTAPIVPIIIQRLTREAGSAENRTVAAEAADAAVTIVYDRKHVIPLTRPGAALAVVKLTKENINEIVAIGRRIGPNYANAYPDLVTALKGVGFTVQEYAHDAPIPSGSNVVAAGRTILFR